MEKAIQFQSEPGPRGTPVAGLLQRKCACGTHSKSGKCDECSKNDRKLQRSRLRSEDTSPEVPDSVHNVLRSSGQPLGSDARAFFDSRFEHDFSTVRVHTDVRAAESAVAVNARAYTVGRDVVFGAGQYAPTTTEGKRLLAHELTHVLQQGASAAPGSLQIGQPNSAAEQEADAVSSRIAENGHGSVRPSLRSSGVAPLQRDLATPAPAPAPAAQPALTKAQIATAIAFNRTRYTVEQTKLIQDIIGTEQTGVWSDADIEAVAQIQEEHGLKKDGIVGFNTFKFLNEELRREKAPTDDAHCLTSFFALGFPAIFHPAGAGQHQLQGHFKVSADFPARCTCPDYEYRQSIRGHFVRRRAGVETDLSGQFTRLPAGSLTPDFREDGDNSATVLNYGHRADPPDPDVENHYIDDKGGDDQPNGCRYRNEDFPGWITLATSPGDEYQGAIQFRGEIQRKGRAVRTLHWNGLSGTFRT